METILIVDDEKNYLVVLEALLGPEGYETVTADNAKDALRLIRDSDLDLVITDMKMPKMSGLELLEATKALKPDLPVIIMTAYGTIEMAVEAMKNSARAAKNLGVNVVNGFTGSSIWHMLYSFPPVSEQMLEEGFKYFAEMWNPIFDVFDECGVKFALEVHPTEIAFDIASARKALEAIDHHPAFGFNYDPSHFGYQGVDYVAFINTFSDKIFHVHMKDVSWSDKPGEAGVFGGHIEFGTPGRFWDFRSLGRGNIDFEEIIRALNRIGYSGPLSVEWEDSGMDREHGATEAADFVKMIDFPPSDIDFDAAFEE